MAIAVRWTIGDVSSRGFDTLAFSIRGAMRVFGATARYAVCVNTVGVETAREYAGLSSLDVEWHDSTGEIPAWLVSHLDHNMAQGVAWKFAPPRLYPEGHELSMDNDVVLWRMPAAVRDWLLDGDSLLIAEDVRPCYGQFASFCPEAARNSGIVGLPPRFDVERKWRQLLDDAGVRLSSETDEQGLQVAMVTSEKHRVVSLDEVSICGYYRPHSLEVGSCGAHFVGVNVKDLASAHGIWDWKRPEVAARVAAVQ